MAWYSSHSPCKSSACHRRNTPSTGSSIANFAARATTREQQQQHRQLPRLQLQQHRQEEARVEVRPPSPVAGPSSPSGNAAAPARIRGENFGGLEPVRFVPGLDPPRGACFECHEPGHTRQTLSTVSCAPTVGDEVSKFSTALEVVGDERKARGTSTPRRPQPRSSCGRLWEDGARMTLSALVRGKLYARTLWRKVLVVPDVRVPNLTSGEPRPQSVKIILCNRVFPYEYISSLEKLQDIALPPPEQFYSSLTDSDISTKDYEDAKQVWDSFKISNLEEYSNIYLKTDVLLLVEVFENFRKTCHEAYELDPAHYYTLPGYSWDSMLLYTQVQLELLTDIDMLLFIEKGIRGGVSQCCSRFSEANNRYMGIDYNPEKEDVYLMYYDINNLYGWAMAQYRPYGGFEWDDAKDYLTLPEDSEYGYILGITRPAQGFSTKSQARPPTRLETAQTPDHAEGQT
ncbi:unnamed protein product [Trichogramma brassicae]|uniref:DNA-directed DNA polymerase n=1 Tax=Trichogramma brassicae TaxID=86971 RepID=A0A6H5IJI9_9HYME|nr:unnamed protein product [Trichogramma brassicae]